MLQIPYLNSFKKRGESNNNTLRRKLDEMDMVNYKLKTNPTDEACRVCMVGYAEYLSDVRIRREAEALVRQGYSVDVICLKQKDLARYEVANGVKIHRISLSKYRGSGAIRYAMSYMFFFVMSAWVLLWLHLKRKYHIIQFHTLPDFIIFAGLTPKWLGAKLLLDMHEVMPEFYMTKFKVPASHWIIRFLRYIEHVSIQFADAVIVVNDPIKRLIIDRCHPHSPVEIIMNTVDEDWVLRNSSKACQTSNTFILMYHGTLTPLYGLDVAIRAMSILKKKIPLIEFWIFGDDSDSDDLKKLAVEQGVQDIVIFKGRIPLSEIPRQIQKVNIGILPTIQDEFIDLSFSNKLAEYVFMNTPVVATKLKSTLEYFAEDSMSYFESGQFEDLASCVYTLYNNKSLREKQTAKAFEHYQIIKWSIMEERYINMIKDLRNSNKVQ